MKILENKAGALNEELMEFFKKDLRNRHQKVVVGGSEYYLDNYRKRYLLPTVTIKILEKAGIWNVNDFVSSIPLNKIDNLRKSKPKVYAEIERKALKQYVGDPQIKSKKVRRSVKMKT